MHNYRKVRSDSLPLQKNETLRPHPVLIHFPPLKPISTLCIFDITWVMSPDRMLLSYFVRLAASQDKRRFPLPCHTT